MARLVVDIETSSECDLTECGSRVYAEHLSTRILCIAYAPAGSDEAPKVWHVLQPNAAEGLRRVKEELLAAEKLIAHNAKFERDVLSEKLSISFRERGRWVCTAMMCGAVGRPRSLKDACRSLCFPEDKQKDSRGVRLIGMFSLPGRKSHKEPSQAPKDFAEFCEYCAQDVIAERAIFQALHTRTDREFIPQWELDCQIDDNGAPIDADEALGAARLYAQIQDQAESLALELTDGAPLRSTTALRAWTAQQGWPMQSFAAAAVDDALADEVQCAKFPKVAEFLRLRQAASGTAGKKFDAMLAMLARDSRVHGILVGRAAHTGRYAGRGVQPQNMPRGSFDKSQLPVIREVGRRAARASDAQNALADLELIAGSQTCSALSSILRDCIAPAGKDRCFVIADYSAIEARVLAWLAGETWVEDVFAGDGKIYERTAAAMYAKSIDSITKDERTIGKIATLALGYGGGTGAFTRMAENYGVKFSEDKAQRIVDTWRASRPKTVKIWSQLDSLIKNATTPDGPKCASIQLSHTALTARQETIAGRQVLALELPSRRKIFYWSPKIVRLENGRSEVVAEMYGQTGDSYAGLTPEAEGSHYSKLYGGKLCENVVQGIAFDLLLSSMLRLNDRGLKICFHVHDEVVVECDKSDAERTADVIASEMTRTPSWAAGLPLVVEPEISDRYKK